MWLVYLLGNRSGVCGLLCLIVCWVITHTCFFTRQDTGSRSGRTNAATGGRSGKTGAATSGRSGKTGAATVPRSGKTGAGAASRGQVKVRVCEPASKEKASVGE